MRIKLHWDLKFKSMLRLDDIWRFVVVLSLLWRRGIQVVSLKGFRIIVC